MKLWATGVGCLLVAACAGAADQPFMSLQWGAVSNSPAEAGQLLDALGRYPSCFDAVRFYGAKPSADVEAALKKLGVAAATGERAPALTYACGRSEPRAMIGSAFLFAGSADLSVARVGTGRQCASGKSAQALCVESMLYLAFGASGLEYGLMGYAHEPSAWYANTYLSELTVWHPYYQSYTRYNAETKPGGFLPFCGKNGKPDLAGTLRAAEALATTGLPLCPGSPWSVGYILTAESVDSMTEVDIQRVLSGGSLLDGGAVAKLQARGYGAAMKMTAQPRDPEIREAFTDDELNRDHVNYVWQPEAAKSETFALFPSNEAARVIGRYQRADGTAAEAASVLTETASGGRIAAFGFAGFGAEVSAARRRQLLLAADWVAMGRLPVFVETVSQLVAVPRVALAGDLKSVTLLNAAIDRQPPVTLRLRGCKAGLETVEWLVPKEKPVALAVRWENKDALVVLPEMAPWQIGWLRLD